MRQKKRAASGRRKRKLYNILIVLIFIAGVAVLTYPAASNLMNQFQQDKVVSGYKEAVGGRPLEELAQIRAQAQRCNEDLLKDEIIVDPFNQVKEKKAGIRYYETLDPQNNGVMGTVRIPSIDVALPIYHGTNEDVLQKAIGHLEQTSLPIGGAGTHAVISGHRGLPSAKLFTDLNLVAIGDVFYIDVLDGTLAYKVDQIKTVEPNELEDLAIIAGEDHVTLVTCTPYAINSHRLLVRGTRIPYDEVGLLQDIPQAQEEHYDFRPYIAAGIVAAVVLVILILMIIRRRKTGRREKR